MVIQNRIIGQINGWHLLERLPVYHPAGNHECKVAFNGTWNENHGLEGEFDGPNMPLSLDENGKVAFLWNAEANTLTIV